MIRAQIGGVKHTATVRNQRHFFLHRFGVVCNSGRLYLWIQAFLQLWVMSCDARWAGILIALKSLYTTQREHESTRRAHDVGAQAQRGRNARRIDHFARRDHFDAFP